MADMVCERKDGVCNLCGADPEEDCPLTDLSPELSAWSQRSGYVVIIDEQCTISDNEECENCQ
jgi:hypothetical protein